MTDPRLRHPSPHGTALRRAGVFLLLALATFGSSGCVLYRESIREETGHPYINPFLYDGKRAVVIFNPWAGPNEGRFTYVAEDSWAESPSGTIHPVTFTPYAYDVESGECDPPRTYVQARRGPDDDRIVKFRKGRWRLHLALRSEHARRTEEATFIVYGYVQFVAFPFVPLNGK